MSFDQPRPDVDVTPGAIHRLLDHLSPRQRRQLLMLIGLTIVGGLAEFVSIGAIGPFIGMLAGVRDFVQLPLLSGRNSAVMAGAVFALAVIVAAALRFLVQLWTQRAVLGIGHDLISEVQRRSLYQPYPYHLKQHSSTLIASLEKVEMVTAGTLMPLVQLAAALITTGFVLAALAWVEPLATVLVGGVVALAYLLTALATRTRLARASRVIASSFEDRVRLLQDSIGAIRDLILDRSQERFLAAFRHADARYTRARVTVIATSAAPRFIMEAAGLLVIAAAALLYTSRAGGLAAALPLLATLALGGQRLLPLLHQVHQGWASLTGSGAVLADLLALLDLPLPARESATPDPLEFRHSVVLSGISFSYEGQRAPVLTGVDLSIPADAMVALVGRTGSGKSTLADIIMGLLQPSSGSLTVDGTPLLAANERAWQQSVAHVPQSVFLFDSSIAANVAMDGDIDSTRLTSALARAQLTDFVASLPDGAETRIGEHGVRLSGGQRQRLGLARAFYKDARFLIIDEGTSALDTATEDALLNALDAWRAEGGTVLLISHRPSAIARCSLVFRLDNGRIVETP